MNKHPVIRVFTNVTPILGLRTRIRDTGRIPAGTVYAEIIPSSSQFSTVNNHFYAHYGRQGKYNTHSSIEPEEHLLADEPRTY